MSIHREGAGPQAASTLYTAPQLPSGPALLAVKGTVAHGNVRVAIPRTTDVLELTGGVLKERATVYFAEPGDVITYTVSQDAGQTATWSFEFYLGLSTDIAFE